MSGSVNKVILVGNLGADPEIRNTQDGRMIVNLRIATSDKWKEKTTGEQKERTEWHRVVIFSEGLCRVAEQYLKKGSTVYIEGQLQTRKWQDQDGNDRYSTEIVIQNYRGDLVLCGGNKGQSQDNSNQVPNGRPGDSRFNNATNPEFSGGGAGADDIPFACEWRV